MELACQSLEAEFYQPRKPRESPFYQLVEHYYDEFERVYPQRYEKKYGFWRPVIGDAVAKFLRCGDVREGFARVRCPDCTHEFFVAFSCRQRCMCPSCHQKRGLMTAIHVAENVCEKVPHRQYVFTIPKRLRIFFRFDRKLLGRLCRRVWETIVEVVQAILDRDDVTPGMVGGIQTHGELIHYHPHVHTVTTDGAFTEDGTFIPLPEVSAEPFLKIWEEKVFQLLLREKKIQQSLIDDMRNWRHSGFSVDKSVYLPAGDTVGIEKLIQYIVRCPFSLGRMINVSDDGKVVYRAEHKDCRKFPMPASKDLKNGVARNFQVFDPLDFLAEVTQHIPEKGEHLIRYYGWYSNKSRGLRNKSAAVASETVQIVIDEEDTPHRKQCRMRWAALIQRVHEVDPLKCPKCGGKMKIISFIEKHQRDVIEKILKHCELWIDPRDRSPPVMLIDDQLDFELEYVNCEDVPMDF